MNKIKKFSQLYTLLDNDEKFKQEFYSEDLDTLFKRLFASDVSWNVEVKNKVVYIAKYLFTYYTNTNPFKKEVTQAYIENRLKIREDILLLFLTQPKYDFNILEEFMYLLHNDIIKNQNKRKYFFYLKLLEIQRNKQK